MNKELNGPVGMGVERGLEPRLLMSGSTLRAVAALLHHTAVMTEVRRVLSASPSQPGLEQNSPNFKKCKNKKSRFHGWAMY